MLQLFIIKRLQSIQEIHQTLTSTAQKVQPNNSCPLHARSGCSQLDLTSWAFGFSAPFQPPKLPTAYNKKIALLQKGPFIIWKGRSKTDLKTDTAGKEERNKTNKQKGSFGLLLLRWGFPSHTFISSSQQCLCGFCLRETLYIYQLKAYYFHDVSQSIFSFLCLKARTVATCGSLFMPWGLIKLLCTRSLKTMGSLSAQVCSYWWRKHKKIES